MPSIQPLQVATGQEPDLATAYWRAVCCSLGYAPLNADLATVAAVAGAVMTQTVSLPLPLPDKVHILAFPDGSLNVLVNGTTAPAQYVGAVAGAAAIPIPPWPGRVHTFFATVAAAVWAFIEPLLIAADPPKVVYMGHSLGGAVALLLATRPQAWRVAGVWSIGAPRVGDGTFVAAVALPCERYTTPGDPVPMLPPSLNPLVNASLWPGFGQLVAAYQHTGVRRELYPNGTSSVRPDGPTWDQAADYLLAVAQAGGDWTAAHASTNYACTIRRAIPLPWAVGEPEWPGIDAIDAVYAASVAGPGGPCVNSDHTFRAVKQSPLPPFARQGRCV